MKIQKEDKKIHQRAGVAGRYLPFVVKWFLKVRGMGMKNRIIFFDPGQCLLLNDLNFQIIKGNLLNKAVLGETGLGHPLKF